MTLRKEYIGFGEAQSPSVMFRSTCNFVTFVNFGGWPAALRWWRQNCVRR